MKGGGKGRVGARRWALGVMALAALGCESLDDAFDGNACEREVVELPPQWECSAEVMAQLAEDQAIIGATSAAPSLSAALVAHDSCDAGLASTRDAMASVADRWLRAKRAELLGHQCLPQTVSRTKGTCGIQIVEANAVPSYDTDGAGAAPSQYSTTNNQVAAVDEADFVKNDESYVYSIARSEDAAAQQPASAFGTERSTGPSNELVILDVWPPEQAHEVARVPLEGDPKKLHLAGDRLLVYASVPRADAAAAEGEGYYGSSYLYPQSDCTYGYECVPTGDGQATLVSVYDVSDRSAPELLRRLELSGSLINSRRIGDVVYTLVADAMALLPGVRVTPDVEPTAPGVAVASFADLANANAARIASATADELLPSIRIKRSEPGSVPEPLPCGTVFEAASGAGGGMLSVVSLSLADDGALPRRATIVSDPGFTYASSSALYVAVPDAAHAWSDPPAERSIVHKFELDGLATRYAASGEIEGSVLNQFAMDEKDGYLRVATSNGRVPNPGVHSALSVLETTPNGLVTVGKVDDIAPGEDIRSVRFAGDRGYVVTFEKTDPLFVFDLSNPAAPRVAGELKIPGFSTLIHPLDAEHLLSIGYDADDQGEFAWFRGIQLQVFDVADMSAPRLAHKTLIGTRGSSSEALDDHLAFNYFPPKRWLTLPVSVCEGGTGSEYGALTFSGLYLYDVSLDSGFGLLGGVAYLPESINGVPAVDCGNWWANASSLVQRTIIMDDYVLSMTRRELKVNHSGDLATNVAVLPLTR